MFNVNSFKKEYIHKNKEIKKLENENYYICRFNMLQNTIDSLK